MSFKREGNDASLLGSLRKRRINELLSEDIPEDEAKLLCNGRFACTVCPSNPVFDTVNVLSVHRNGKKHLSNLDIHIAKKRELKQLIAARRHQQFLKDGTTSIKMAVSNDGGLLTSCPYDPRVKKNKVAKGERRPILEISTKCGTSKQHSPSHQDSLTSTVVASANRGTCSSSVLRETHDQSLSGPIMHGHQLKTIFTNKFEETTKFEEPTRITPYQSKFRRNRTSMLKNNDSTSVSKELPDITISQDSAFTRRLRPGVLTCPDKCTGSSSVVNVSSQNTLSSNLDSGAIVSASKSSPLERVSSSVVNCFLQSSIQSHSFVSTSPLLLPPPPPPPASSSSSSFTSTKNCSQTSSVSSVKAASVKSLVHEENNSSKEQNRVSEKLRQLQGSGWKRDWDGKWIKDENAEFDSDEEAPDIP